MKLVTYRTPGETSNRTGRTGILIDAHVLDLGPAVREFLALNPLQSHLTFGADSVLEMLQQWEIAEQLLPLVIEWARGGDASRGLFRRLDDVELMAPVPRPTSMRDGYAFRQHVEAARRNRGVEMIPEFDEFPVFYFTNHQAVTGPGVVEVLPRHCEKLDFELECAIVIGREGRNIKASEADGYIAGYTVMNDWSARALQMKEMTMSLGPAKGKDFATSIGPYLATRDELAARRIDGPDGERYDLTMVTRVNGTEVSRQSQVDDVDVRADHRARVVRRDALSGRRHRLRHGRHRLLPRAQRIEDHRQLVAQAGRHRRLRDRAARHADEHDRARRGMIGTKRTNPRWHCLRGFVVIGVTCGARDEA
jgi:2-keto-4-pentenoate hydratase/2-oxohepta-3-ene-1,7-dioic acid hydratase in catechol pathway